MSCAIAVRRMRLCSWPGMRGCDLHDVAMRQVLRGQILLADEQHVAPPEHAAVAVVEAVDGRVVLVMAAQRGQLQHIRPGHRRVLRQPVEGDELRLAGFGVPDPLGRAQRQTEAAGVADARIVVLEVRIDGLDLVADQIVIGDQPPPIHLAGRQRRHGDAGDDRGLRTQMFRGRLQLAARGVDHRHRILDRHRLRAGRLDVALGAAEDGQDDRLLADQQVRAVQLGVQMHRQIQVAHALVAEIGVGQRDREIAAQADQHLGLARPPSPASP